MYFNANELCRGFCATLYSGSSRKMTSEGGFVQPSIPRFNVHYDHWSKVMENFLRSKDKELCGLADKGYEVQTEAQ